MVPILKQRPEMHQGQRLWLVAGTGEGPPLAARLLQRGWRLRVSVVSAAAAAAYRPLVQVVGAERLELAVGALAGAASIAQALQQAARQGDGFAAVVDATHPFAVQISPALQQACAACQLPLLRLERETLQADGATLLGGFYDLAGQNLTGVPVLLAIGARQLGAAVEHSPGALHHARVLPNPAALQLALAAGLSPSCIACLRPSEDFAVEAALVTRWRIGAIVCRQSGGRIEAGWRGLSQRLGCRLLLLQRPQPQQQPGLPWEVLLARLEDLAAGSSRG